ncbi:MAG: endonuclease III [Clostridiales bacterium]|nr:endonuclease III [Clostridiales bacterium]
MDKNMMIIIEKLNGMFPDAKAELDFTSPFELLIATILSAQCTDIRVNKITKVLFKYGNTPEKMLAMGQNEIKEIIKSCGMFKTKSKYLVEVCKKLIDQYDSKVPETLEDLMKLDGVGRKTANVVVSNAFGIQAIAVDTHVFRVSNRLGIVNGKNVEETEKQLMEKVPEEYWTKLHHQLIFLGRRVCKARKPLCEECILKTECKFYKNK